MAAVVASEVASVLGTLVPISPPMAPPSGYHTPPVPPVAMLKENLPAACTPGAAQTNRARTVVMQAMVLKLRLFMAILLKLSINFDF